MANPEHLKILRRGVEVWNRWREERPHIRPDLSGTNLYRTNLQGANLSRANFRGANLGEIVLVRSDLSQADFRKANLRGAYLAGANFQGANLSGLEIIGADFVGGDLRNVNFSDTHLHIVRLTATNLKGADFSRTHLDEVNFSGANLQGAVFRGASTAYSIFANVDISDAIGLDTISHRAPSYVDFHTAQRSKGKISETFFRGCGLSDWQIENAKLHRTNLTSAEFTNITYKIHELLIDNPIQYYSCFISSSHQDEEFVQRLHNNLQDSGVRCWNADEDMKIGDKIRHTIDQSIRIHDKLLLILSENSLNSEWVESEVEKAFEEERQRKQTVLFPVRLDEAVMETDQPWAAEIRRTRHIGDFTRWKDHDAYQLAFERLLRDLKAEE